MTTEKVLALISFILAYNLVSVSFSAAELMSLDQIEAMNEFAPCFSRIHKEFVACNKEAINRGRKYLDGMYFKCFSDSLIPSQLGLDKNSEWYRRLSCCGMWMVRDCWYEAALKRCPMELTDSIRKLPYTMLGPKLEVTCKGYQEGSDACKIPYFLITCSILVILCLLGLAIFCAIRCYRRFQRRRTDEDDEDVHEKPTSV